MQKIRLELLEHMTAYMDGRDVAKLAFSLIDQSIGELLKMGIEVGHPEYVILNNIEYRREDLCGQS